MKTIFINADFLEAFTSFTTHAAAFKLELKLQLQLLKVWYSTDIAAIMTIYSLRLQQSTSITKRRGRVVNTPTLYSRGPRFDSHPATGYRDWGFSWFYSGPLGECQDSTLN
jgi:hypothetical protein